MTYKRAVFYILNVILILELIIFIPYTYSYQTPKLKVLFDESHNQYFSYTNKTFVSALNYLNQSGNFIVNLNTNKSLLNYTNLKNYDILVIPNPGYDNCFTNYEIQSIINWTKEGGSLIILSDFINQPNTNKSGKPATLNNILKNLSLPFEFLKADMIDDDQNQNYNGQPSIIKINQNNFNDPIIGDKISSLLVRTSCINITSSNIQYYYAVGPSNSYYYISSLYKIYKPPIWLVRYKLGQSTIILCGATEIFSDEINPSIGISWFSIQDNVRLWANIFNSIAVEKNEDVWQYFLIIAVFLIIGAVSLYIYNRTTIKRTKSRKVISSSELKNELLELKELAEKSYSNKNYRLAARYYRRAALICKKINAMDEYKNYQAKLKECLIKK